MKEAMNEQLSKFFTNMKSNVNPSQDLLLKTLDNINVTKENSKRNIYREVVNTLNIYIETMNISLKLIIPAVLIVLVLVGFIFWKSSSNGTYVAPQNSGNNSNPTNQTVSDLDTSINSVTND